MKYYAVKVGRHPGIYTTWDACKEEVDGFKNAEFKRFSTKDDAEKFMGCQCETTQAKTSVDYPDGIAYVDGSYNPSTGVYGYGGFVTQNGEKHYIQGCGHESDMSGMRNVAGEILGAVAAVIKAKSLNMDKLTIYYDYLGIEKWATGQWSANKPGTIAYQHFMEDQSKNMDISFRKVKAHTGVDGNEEADRLAKESVGI